MAASRCLGQVVPRVTFLRTSEGVGVPETEEVTAEPITPDVDIDAVRDPLCRRPKKKQKTAAAPSVPASVVPVLLSPATTHARSSAVILARATKDGKFDAAHLKVADLKLICRLNGIAQSDNKIELVGKVNTYLSTAARTPRPNLGKVGRACLISMNPFFIFNIQWLRHLT